MGPCPSLSTANNSSRNIWGDLAPPTNACREADTRKMGEEDTRILYGGNWVSMWMFRETRAPGEGMGAHRLSLCLALCSSSVRLSLSCAPRAQCNPAPPLRRNSEPCSLQMVPTAFPSGQRVRSPTPAPGTHGPQAAVRGLPERVSPIPGALLSLANPSIAGRSREGEKYAGV